MALSLELIIHPAFRHTLATEPPVQRSLFEELPQDVLRVIASNVAAAQDVATLVNLQAVNKRCREVASADVLWKRLCMKAFAVPENCSPPSWQQLYRFNHQFLYKVLLSHNGERLSGYRVPGTRMPRLDAPIFIAA